MINPKNNPFILDWGAVSVDSFNVKTKNANTILNFNFEISNNLKNIYSYTTGYILSVHKNFPRRTTITIVYDIRGQSVNIADLKEFEKEIINHLNSIDTSIKVNIVFNQ